MEENAKNMFEYLTMMAKNMNEKFDVDKDEALAFLQNRLNPFEPKPKDTFSPVKLN